MCTGLDLRVDPNFSCLWLNDLLSPDWVLLNKILTSYPISVNLKPCQVDNLVFQLVFWLKAGVELHVVVVATAVSNSADRS